MKKKKQIKRTGKNKKPYPPPQKKSAVWVIPIIISGILLTMAIFYALKQDSTNINLNIEVPISSSNSDNNESTIVYPGITNLTVQYLLNGNIYTLNDTDIEIQEFRNVFYQCYLTFNIPFGTTEWQVTIYFNVTISNATVRVNGMELGELNSPITEIETIGNGLIIHGRYSGRFNVHITFPFPSKKND